VAETQRALKAAPAYPELAGSVRWLRANPILAAGVLLIAAQLWWQAGLLGRSFFRLDDYIYLEHASTSGLTWSYLTWVDAGHLDVVGSAIVWALVRISPEDWTLATADRLGRRMGDTGIHILTRFMGLLLMAIAVQFILSGLSAAGFGTNH